ncbi:recombinase family protein [Nocardia sp. NPDC051052]|uniref:recombinase family protein n=1 Tax=Nocardia sp. NPDC051052 TaxID=3364322 RepID=UPI0037B5B073
MKDTRVLDTVVGLDATLDLAISYLRVSTKKQLDTAIDIDPDGNSIATQRKTVDGKATSLPARIEREFLEPGNSAQTIEKRKVFNEMIDYLRAHPGIKYVIVYSRSRAFRNYIDAAITKRMLQKMGVRLVSAREDFGEGLHAEMMEAVTDVFNDIQNRLSGEDIRIKMMNKATSGGTIGRAKLGYLNVRVDFEGRQINTIQLDEKRAPLVLKAWELYASGEYTIERLEATMADLGLTNRPSGRWPVEQPVSDSKFHQMLRDPYYAGYVEYKGSLYPGRHEPIVGQELFDQVQDVLNARSSQSQRDRVHQHYLKGGLFCQRCHDAGRTARLIFSQPTGRDGTSYAYFVCRARQEGLCDLPHLRVELVEAAIVEHYKTLQLPADFASATRRLLEEAVSNEQTATRELHTSLTRQLKDLDTQENRLIDLAAHDTMPQAKIRARLLQIQSKRAQLEAGLANSSEQLAVGAGVLRDALHLVADPYALYRDSIDAVRRHLNQTFYERLYIDDLAVTDEKTSLFAELHDAGRAYCQNNATTSRPTSRRGPKLPQNHPTGENDPQQQESPRDAEALLSRSTDSGSLTLTDVFSVNVSSKAVMVELRGLEPLTPTLPKTTTTTDNPGPSCIAGNMPLAGDNPLWTTFGDRMFVRSWTTFADLVGS